MRRFAAAAMILVGMWFGTGVGHAQDPTPVVLGEYVLYDDAAQQVTFTIRFDADPSAALLNSDGFRAELSFGYFVFTDGDTSGGPVGSERIVEGRTIIDTGQVMVQDTQPTGTGPNGWGALRGMVDYQVVPVGGEFLLQTIVGYDLLGDDGRFAYDMIVAEFGSTSFGALGTSAATPPASVAVTPNTEVLGGDDVLLELDGFAASSSVEWSLCKVLGPDADDLRCGDPLGTSATDATGSTGPLTQRIDRWVYINDEESFDDCARTRDPCAIAATDAAGTTAWAQVGIVDPGPLPSGSIRLQPESVDNDGEEATVIGADFRAGAVIEIRQCTPAVRTPSDCNGRDPIATVIAGPSGKFRATINISRSVSPLPGVETLDCFVVSESCRITAADAADFSGTFVSAPIAGPARPVVTIGDISVSENTGVLSLPVTLSEATTIPVTVQWSTLFTDDWSSAAAVPGEDYIAASGQVTFLPGETVLQIDIVLVDDAIAEPDQMLAVALSAPVGATIGGYWGLGFGGITDDDVATPL